MLKIAFYSDTYLPAVDGVVTSMLNFKKELERRGHKVFIFAPGTIADKKKYERNDVFIHTGIKFKPYPQYSVALFPYHSILKLKRLGVDLIHAQTPFALGFNGLLASKIGGYPLVGSFHTMLNDSSVSVYLPKNFKSFYRKYMWKYAKFFYRRCDAVIAPSNSVKAMLERRKIKNVFTVPNGIDTKTFNTKVDPEKAIKAFGLDTSRKIVLYVGRVSKEKSIDVLLKAMAKITKKREDVELVIGGTGPMLDRMKALAKRLGLDGKVKFLGFVRQDLLPSLYAASTVFCLPSDFETQGIVCLEAMATGKPVVTANTQVMKEFVKKGKNGELFAPGNYLDCSRKIEIVLNNSDAYKKEAVSTAKQFSLENTTNMLIDVYKDVLGRFTEYQQ